MDKGLLDLLDHVDRVLSRDEEEGPPPCCAKCRSLFRRMRQREHNARLGIQEIRRRIERVGQETRT